MIEKIKEHLFQETNLKGNKAKAVNKKKIL